MYKHIIAAASELKDRSDTCEMVVCSTRSATHLASSASEIGARPSWPLATMDSARALIAGERTCSSGVPRRDGRTPTQAPHMRESEVGARSET